MVKVICPNCGSKTNNIKFHVCERAISTEVKDLAFIGDSMHQLDVVTYLIIQGFHSSDSHKLLPLYCSAESQVEYFKTTSYYKEEYNKMSKHNVSTIFEALYCESTIFREQYKKKILNTIY